MIRFAVIGCPVPQGSKTARILGKRIRVGGQMAILGGRVALIEVSDLATKTRKGGSLKRWRARVAESARREMRDRSPHIEPVRLSAEFVLPRPPSHWLKSGRTRKGAPSHPGTPDLSKLIRAVEDALTGIVYGDDRQVVSYGDVFKRYASKPDSTGGAYVAIEAIPNGDDSQDADKPRA